MAFSSLSFLLGAGAAYLLPTVFRNVRPIAVEAVAMGLGLFDDARRMVAEQMENLEDIAAEARARRQELAEGAMDEGEVDVEGDDGDADDGAEPPDEAPRRRGGTRSRPRTS